MRLGSRWYSLEEVKKYNLARTSFPPKPSKYHAVPLEVDNIRFASKKEARRYQELKALQHAGDVKFFLMQVPFQLPGNVKYRLDFMVFWKTGNITYEDVKGFRTPIYKIKRKQVEGIYPIKILEL